MKTRTTLILLGATAVLGILIGRYVLSRGVPATGTAAPPAAEGRKPDAATVWTCSMHPQIRQDHPGRCPICGMDLVPAAAGGIGDGRVTLSPGAQQVASIEVTTLTRRPLEHELRTVGRVEYAEPLVAYLTARVAARVERVYADFTGVTVAAGDHLVDLYSPELVVAQQELLSSRVAGSEDVAREKLLLLGVTEEQLAAIETEGRPRTVLTVHTPVGGTVIEKNVRDQMYVQVGDPLYTIADLSTVWLYADIYEYELPWVAIGQRVDVTLEAAPGESFTGTVAFVEQVVREATRTVRVRVNLPNPDGRLKPGMFAHATIHAALSASGTRAPSPLAGRWVCPMHPDVTADATGTCPRCGMDLQKVEGGVAPATETWACPMHPDVTSTAPGSCSKCGMDLEPVPAGPADAGLLAVPASAVLDSGLRQVVWVEREPGRYEAAEVRLGPRAGDVYPVLSGLAEGDRVVVHGNFLLDSQAQIEGKPSLLFPHGLDFGAGAPAGHAGH
jgi:membrane fusion protein, copper/silver efflux system